LIGKRDEEFLEETVMRGEGMGQKVCTEMSIQTPQGLIKGTEVCIAPTQSEDGQIKTYAYIRDITERKKFEKELKESEEKFRNLFERVQHGLYISTKEGRFVDCNQAMWGVLGYQDKEEFLKIDIARDLYVKPEDRKTFQGLVEKQGFVKDFEVEWKKKNGEKITVSLTAHAKKNEKEEIIGYEGIKIDMSDRKRMEKELKEANDFLINLIESSVDGIIVTDTKGNILIFNKGAENILGYNAEEVVGKMNIRSIYPPGVAKEVMEKLRSPDYGGMGKLTSFPIAHRRKDGELIEGDLSASLIFDEEGKEIASVGIFKDLRERLRIERELREMQQALLQSEKLAAMGRLTSQIAHELNNPIYGIMNTLELLKTEVPPESKRRRILELSLSETQRLAEMLRNMLSFSKPEEERRKPTKINELVEGILLVMEKLKSPDYGGVGKLTSFPIAHRRKDGELIEGDLSASLIYDEKGNEIASVGIFKDLRERLRIERELREMQQALLQSEKLAAMGRLTSQIAHELNNPIYGIMNTLELLKTEIPPESKRRRILELSLSETQRLAEMLRNMLSFSKPEEEKRKLIKINELAEGVLLMMERQMRESNIKVETYFDEGIPEVMASTNQMRQVMLNLIKNAKEAMPKGGTLTVRTSREDSKVLIHIQDTGVGIPEELRDKIFEAFFTTKQKVKGVGLGLSVCYGIIKDHGGEIKVASEVDKGTTFTIHLPI
jgi:PAS domain S-box-containing protein